MSDPEEMLLHSLYLGVRDNAGFEEALEQLARMFQCPSATFVDFDAVAPETSIFCGTGLLFEARAQKAYNETFAAIDPAPAAFARLRPGRASTAVRLIGAKEAERSEFLQEFFRQLGLGDCLGGTLASGNGRFALIGLHRGPDRPDFSDDELHHLERLTPHLARALQLRRSFLALEQRARILSDATDRLAAGIMAFNEDGVMVTMNWAARSFIARRDGLTLDRSGRLIANDAAGNAALRSMRADILQGGAGGIVRIVRREGRPPYVILVSPMPLGDESAPGHARGSLLVIHDPALKRPAPVDSIKAIFGLGDAAARVVAAIFQGDDLRDYAERNAVSINTVKFHLKSAFSRMGVRSQTALTRMVAHALRDLGARDDDRKK